MNSDHKIINVFIELFKEDYFIVGKLAKWKTNRIIPHYEKKLINDNIETIDTTGQQRFEY